MRHIGWNRKELREIGYIAARDGVLLDNRDGFYADHADDFVRTYDCRTCATYNPDTHVVMSRGLWEKIAAALEGPCST